MSNSLAHDVSNALSESVEQIDSSELREAFVMFNEMSQQLSDSYTVLEKRVVELSGELATASQQRLQELAEKERLADRLESLLQMLPAGVLLLDQKGWVKQSNTAADELLLPLVKPATLVGQRWRTLIQKCFQPRQDDGHEISLVDGKRVHLRTAPMSNEPGQLILLTDMTETRALQSQLSQHERLSAMGKMVASLAHQVRTPLSAATLYAGHLASDDLQDDMRKRFAGKLQERLHHLENQIRDMLIFARGDIPMNDWVSLSDIEVALEAAMNPIMQNQDAAYEIVNLCPQASIRCNKDVLVSALMNLVNNALEASSVIDAKINVRIQGSDEQVVILITDNGPGLKKEEREKILQPFYTTKANGTGLGLAVVQAVAKAHQAEFIVMNNANGGLSTGMILPREKQS